MASSAIFAEVIASSAILAVAKVPDVILDAAKFGISLADRLVLNAPPLSVSPVPAV